MPMNNRQKAASIAERKLEREAIRQQGKIEEGKMHLFTMAQTYAMLQAGGKGASAEAQMEIIKDMMASDSFACSAAAELWLETLGA